MNHVLLDKEAGIFEVSGSEVKNPDWHMTNADIMKAVKHYNASHSDTGPLVGKQILLIKRELGKGGAMECKLQGGAKRGMKGIKISDAYAKKVAGN